jgi:hypothetical protein
LSAKRVRHRRVSCAVEKLIVSTRENGLIEVYLRHTP